MVTYCRSDCTLLLAGIEKYLCEIERDFPGLRVFSSLTLSSFANRLFRSYFMPPQSCSFSLALSQPVFVFTLGICVLKPCGYGVRTKHSKQALAWLYTQKKALGLTSLRSTLASLPRVAPNAPLFFF